MICKLNPKCKEEAKLLVRTKPCCLQCASVYYTAKAKVTKKHETHEPSLLESIYKIMGIL